MRNKDHLILDFNCKNLIGNITEIWKAMLTSQDIRRYVPTEVKSLKDLISWYQIPALT